MIRSQTAIMDNSMGLLRAREIYGTRATYRLVSSRIRPAELVEIILINPINFLQPQLVYN